jgi:hypothetical protein
MFHRSLDGFLVGSKQRKCSFTELVDNTTQFHHESSSSKLRWRHQSQILTTLKYYNKNDISNEGGYGEVDENKQNFNI